MGRAAALALAACLATTVWAHHGWGEYDAGKPLKLTGKIVAAGYEHPHGFIRLAAAGKTWLCILAPPTRMEARGLAKDALKPGVAASVEGFPSRSKSGEMRAERITVGGKTIELR
jgi:hypothetical protein